MSPVNLGVKALVTWVNSIILTDRKINIKDLKDGDIILRVISRIKNEPFTTSIKTTEERFELIAEFVQKDCRFSPTNDASLSWENIKNGINLSVEIAKLLLLLVYHDMMNERSTLKTLECEVEREIANLTGSFILESFGCVYLKSGLDTYLAKRHLSVDHETLDRAAVSSLSEEDSPVFHLTPKVTFLNIHTVASSSVSKSPLQDLMNTPKFQLRKLQRQIIQERQYRDGLERELAGKISVITSKESHINRLEYNLEKTKVDQNNQEQNTKAKIDELESQIDSLKLRLHEILKEYKDFKRNSSLAERKVDELEEEKGVLSSQVRAAYAQLSTSQTEVSRLKETLASCQEEWRTKINYLNSELNQATFHKDVLTEQVQILQGKISCLEDDLKAARKEDVGENMGPVIERENLQCEIVQLKFQLDKAVGCLSKAAANEQAKKATLLKEKEQEQASKRLKIELQEQLFAKSEAVQHYKAQFEKAVSHYYDKKQLLHDSQEEVAKLKHSLEVRELEVKATSMENKLLQMELEKAQSKEKNMLSVLARLEAQVAYADLNLQAQNRIPGHEGGVSELCHTKIEPKRSVNSDSLDPSSLEDSVNNTRFLMNLSAPDESSTPLIRSSERLAAKRSALKESLETLYFTPISTRHRRNAENKTEMGCAFVNPSSSVKRRRTTPVNNVTLTKKTPCGGEDDETFCNLTSARSQPNLSSATGVRPISIGLFETPGKMTAAGNHQLSGLPGYRRSTLHSQSTSTFCVGAENEPAGPSDDWMRIAELQARNKACLPHLKSSYPVELENGSNSTFLFTDEEVRIGEPTETIRRASLMPGQLQRSVAAHRHSLAAPQSTVGARSHRLSLMADHRPSKLVSSSQLRSPRSQKRSAFTLSVPLTSPEKKMKASCFPRPLTPKNKNSNTGSSSSQLHAAPSPTDCRQSMVFTIDNTPKSNRSNYLKKGLNKLRSATRKSPGKTPKGPPVNSAHKKNMLSATSIVAPGRGVKSKSFRSPQVKDNRKSPKPGGKPAKSTRLTASARKIKT
ncbi:uncharacterized protein LOC144084055 isoform X2 [Stigmatopora argus]